MNVKEISEFLKGADDNFLFKHANRIRKKYCGDGVFLRALIEFSNVCFKNCFYCGLRRENKKLKRYSMSYNEIYKIALIAKDLGFKTVVLQSGEKSMDVDKFCEVIKKIKDLGLVITLSLGELDKDYYRKFKDSGADKFLLKFETSNRSLYEYLKPDSHYDKRFKILEWLRDMGYEVGSGIMVGLPGQSIEDIASDIMIFKKLDLDMISVGPFVPNPDTPLGNARIIDENIFLRAIAITRIVNKNVHMPATTSAEVLYEDGRKKALLWGANVIMPDITPKEYSLKYIIYPGKEKIIGNARNIISDVEKMLLGISRYISQDEGRSLKRRVYG